jgi:hypothetical protein
LISKAYKGGVNMKSTKSNKVYSFLKEKRSSRRTDFDLEIIYPRVNDKNVSNPSGNTIMRALNISEAGICISSEVPLKKGDFLDILLSIKGNPSFTAIIEIKWVGYDDEAFLAGGEFLCLTMNQINTIRSFVKQSLER